MVGRTRSTGLGEHDENVKSPNKLAKAWKRMLSSNAELESEDLQQASKEAGAVPIESCTDRDKVTLSGTVSTLVIDPTAACSGLKVEVRDGSGSVTCVWLGRNRIPGIEAGRTVRVTGRVSCKDGRKVMFNPSYELLT